LAVVMLMIEIMQTDLVEKKNELNEMRSRDMTLQELRFFSIYLSRINPRDSVGTRNVKFSIEEFSKIMDLKCCKAEYFREVTKRLLQKVISIPSETGGYKQFQLFKYCQLEINDEDGWYVEINAHDMALPLMFDFKKEYFRYELWNVLRLNSANQIRMYEILKQYESIGYRILTVKKLRDLLGILPAEHARWNNFKVRVLDSCKQALDEYTDISYTYDPYGKKGKGGKILQLKFTIMRNRNYIDRLNLKEFLNS
jgi:plasmid replication initiation protein